MTRPCSSGGQPDRYLHPTASDAMECVDRIIAEDKSYDATTSELVTGREHLFQRALHLAGERREEEEEAGRSRREEGGGRRRRSQGGVSWFVYL